MLRRCGDVQPSANPVRCYKFCMPLMRLCLALVVAMNAGCGFAQSGALEHPAGGATAVIDTTLGRLRCRLLEAEAPASAAHFIELAEGTKEGNRFYDGRRLYSVPAGIRGGSRTEEETKDVALKGGAKLMFDRPGRLALRGKDGRFGAEFMVLDHANAENDGENALVFGQCDEASVKVVTAISHRLAAVDNRPVTPIAINHVAIVRDGQPMPPLSANVLPAAVTPKLEEVAQTTAAAPEPSGPRARIKTSMGTLSCRLFTKESPVATGVFMGLAEGTKEWTNPVTHHVEHGKPYYDGMLFDRVIPDFVIQSGDFTGDISGGTDIGFRFRNENSPGLSFDRPGRLAFGNNGPDTNNSEIFITEHPMRRLDGGFTIIGQCDAASVRLVEKIARVPRDAHNRPIRPVRILRIRFISR